MNGLIVPNESILTEHLLVMEAMRQSLVEIQDCMYKLVDISVRTNAMLEELANHLIPEED